MTGRFILKVSRSSNAKLSVRVFITRRATVSRLLGQWSVSQTGAGSQVPSRSPADVSEEAAGGHVTLLCAGSHCINPPVPDSKYNLKLLWNENFPPAHNETIMFACWAGNTWNRFEHDFGQWNLTVSCLPENTFEEVSEWPQCLDCKLFSQPD